MCTCIISEKNNMKSQTVYRNTVKPLIEDCTLVNNKIVDHPDVVGASPVGAAPTTSSFLTWHLASRDSEKTATRQCENILNVGIWCSLYQRLDGTSVSTAPMSICLFIHKIFYLRGLQMRYISLTLTNVLPHLNITWINISESSRRKCAKTTNTNFWQNIAVL